MDQIGLRLLADMIQCFRSIANVLLQRQFSWYALRQKKTTHFPNGLDQHNKPKSETTYWPVQEFVLRFEKELGLLSEQESGEIILTSWD